jgi:alpha-tubulin suppressor-like RCC1 family protein
MINGIKAVDMWSSSDSHTNGHYATVFIKLANGVIYATGYNAHGQLGCGDNVEHLSFVQSLFGTHDIVDIQGISVSDSRGFVAVTAEGKALVWGYGGTYDLGMPSATPPHNTMPKEITWI